MARMRADVDRLEGVRGKAQLDLKVLGFELGIDRRGLEQELVVENQKIADRVFVKGVLDRQYGMRQSTGDEILQTSITNSGHSLIG